MRLRINREGVFMSLGCVVTVLLVLIVSQLLVLAVLAKW